MRPQGFDDCATVFASFKLIESFEGLLEREFIQADLERKHLELLKAYGKDLRDVQDTFTRQKAKSAEGFYLERDGPPLYMNMPPVSGALYWARGLLDRVREPMDKLTAMLKVKAGPLTLALLLLLTIRPCSPPLCILPCAGDARERGGQGGDQGLRHALPVHQGL